MTLEEKYNKLKEILSEMGGVAVGFSGGVDSTLLLKVANETLQDRAVGVTATSFSFPERELKEAKRLGKRIGADLRIVHTEEGTNPQFLNNPVNRCYFCRSELFTKMSVIAKKEGLRNLADGTNTDDDYDFRPGSMAQRKFNVRSPLREAGLNKSEIRELAKRLGLDNHDKPAFACLASRIPYGSEIKPEILRMVEKAEGFLNQLGFSSVRVRHYGNTARIEVGVKELNKITENGVRRKIITALKEIGYTYITLDLEGFRSGSMNEVIDREKVKTSVDNQ